jgi:hypothetical protein
MKNLSLLVIVLGVIALVMGGIYIGLGFTRDSQIKAEMRAENVTLGALGITGPDADKVIASMSTAEEAANTIKEHRHSIAPSYQALLNGGRFDPTNPQHLSYSQAINLENYLYLGVLALGMTTSIMGSGAFMVVTGAALILLGWMVRKLAVAQR